MLGKLGVVFGNAGRDRQHWSVLADEYIEALADQPLEALLKGATDWRDDPTSRWFPLPGQLKGRCDVHAKRLRTALWRCRMLASAQERAKPPEPTPEELEERKRQVEEWRAMAGVKKMPEAPTPQAEAPLRDSLAKIDNHLADLRRNPIRRGRDPEPDSELFS